MRTRYSDRISERQAINVLEAASFAAQIGKPLNKYITLNFAKLKIEDHEVTPILGRYIKYIQQWSKRRCSGHSQSYIYIRETNQGGNSHVHIMLSVPNALNREFRINNLKWIKLAIQRKFTRDKGFLETRSIGPSYLTCETNPLLYGQNLEELVRYLLKETTEDTREKLMMEETKGKSNYLDKESKNIVIGRRVGVSENIGRKARSSNICKTL